MTTKLDILNHMLNVIGETPVTSADSNHPSALSATITLNRVDKEVQSRGWWFNTEYALTLLPNGSGEIVLPQNTLSVDPTSITSKLVRRGSRLYDPVTHSYNIGVSVAVDCILQLPIEDLPETAATYILHRSAYDFYVNDDGDETKSNRLEKEMSKAWAALQKEYLQVSNVDALDRQAVVELQYRLQRPLGSYHGKLPV